jgi:hypothetical protein
LIKNQTSSVCQKEAPNRAIFYFSKSFHNPRITLLS